MAAMHKVQIKVVSQKGTCSAGHRVGDSWLMTEHTPEGLCVFALDTLFPYIQVLAFGGTFPWEPDPDAARVCCSDPDNPVVFEIRRIRE